MKTTRSRGEAARQRRLLLQRVLSVVLAASMTLQGLAYAPVRAYAEGEDDAATVELAGGEGLAAAAEEGQAEEGQPEEAQPEEGTPEEGQQPSGGQGDEQPAEPSDGQGDEQPAEPTGEQGDEQPAEPTDGQGDEQPAEPADGQPTDEQPTDEQPADETDEVTVGHRAVTFDVKDGDGSVKATVEVEGDLPSDATLAVSEVSAEDAAKLAGEAAEAKFAYDVTIVSQGAAWHPEEGAKLTVRVTRPEGMEGLPEGLAVVHFKDVVVTKGADESFALDADALATLAARVADSDETLATETAEVTLTDDGRLQFELTGLSPFVGATPKAEPAPQLRASADGDGHEGSGTYGGLEYGWSIKWDAGKADGTNFEGDDTHLEFHPTDWTGLCDAVLKVKFHASVIDDEIGGSIPVGAIKYRLPLHAFYGWDQNADYITDGATITYDTGGTGVDKSSGYEQLVVGGQELFKYEIDEENQELIITNWQPITATDMSLQISYKVDPTRVNGGHPSEPNVNVATASPWWENYVDYYNKTLPASFEMDTNLDGTPDVIGDAPLDIALKSRAVGTGYAIAMPTPTQGVYLAWDETWGEQPADSDVDGDGQDDYFYLVWNLGYGWGYRAPKKNNTYNMYFNNGTYVGPKYATQGWEAVVTSLDSDNEITIGDETFKGELVGIDAKQNAYQFPAYTPSVTRSENSYLQSNSLSGLANKTANTYRNVNYKGYRGYSLENVLAHGEGGRTTNVYAGGNFAILMRYPKKMFQKADEVYGPGYSRDTGLQIGAKFTITENWDSGYANEKKIDAVPNTVTIKSGSGGGNFAKSSGGNAVTYKTVGGGQTLLLGNQDVLLHSTNSSGGTYTESWSMVWTGNSFAESIEGGGSNNLGQHIEITDTEDSTLLISSSKATSPKSWTPSDQTTLDGDNGDYSIRGFWLALNEYGGTYDASLDVWQPNSSASTSYADYEPVYIYYRTQGSDSFEPYAAVRKTGSDKYTVKQWDGTTEGATIAKRYGHYALPENTVQVKAVHDSKDFVRCALRLYVGMTIHPTDHVKQIVQQHVDAGATTYLKDVTGYKVTPAIDPTVASDAYISEGHNINDPENDIIYLNNAPASLSLSKSSYVPADNAAIQSEAKLRGVQVSYVQLVAYSYLGVDQAETIRTNIQDPYKLLSGTFYELLPKGCKYQEGSVKIMYDMNHLTDAMETVNYQTVQNNTTNRKAVPQENITVTQSVDEATGQVMLKIDYWLDDPGIHYSHNYPYVRNYARCYFIMENPLDNIQTYGRQTVNACGFVDTTEGAAHTVGTQATLDTAQLGDKAAAFTDLANSDVISRFAKSTITWNALSYTETSFGKAVASTETLGGMPTGDQFNAEQDATINNEYTYRLLWQINDSTKAKDIIYYDVLESGTRSGAEIHESAWQGDLVGVDVSSIAKMENNVDSSATCAPVVYYSTEHTEMMSTSTAYDLTDGTWTKADDYSGDLADVTAIAVDCSKDSKGNEFIMGPSSSMIAFVTMKAPGEVPSDGDPIAVNGAVLEAEAFGVNASSGTTSKLLGEARVLLHDIDVSLTKDSNPATGTASEPTIVAADGTGQIVYRLTARNTGNYDARSFTITDVLPEGLTLAADQPIKVALNGLAEEEATDGTSTTGFEYEYDEDSRTLTFTIARQQVTTMEGDEVVENNDTHIYIYCDVDTLYAHTDDSGNEVAQVMSRDYENTATLVSANEKDINVETETTYHRAETKQTSVEKVWSDDNDRDGIRPDDVEVTLTGKAGNETVYTQAVTLDEDGDWAHTYANLDKYVIDDSEASYEVPTTADEIAYDTLTETETDVITGTNQAGEYAYAVTGSETAGYTVTNTHTPVKITVNVEKAWTEDSNNLFELRVPVTVKLLADDADSGKTVTLNEGNSWKGSFTNLYKFRDHGTEIVYTIDEIQVPGYKEGVIAGGSVDTGFSYTVTNELDKVNVTLTKTWDDLDNLMGDRPDTNAFLTKLTLKQNNTAFTKVTPTIVDNEDNTYTVTWTGLPKTGSDGNAYTYTISEAAITNYNGGQAKDATLVDPADPYTFEVTNVRDKGDLTVTKTVHSRYDADKSTDKTFSFTVKLFKADGTTPLSGTFGGVAFTNGEATFTLSHEGTKEIKGIPTTAKYEVTETADAQFKTTKTGDTGTIALNSPKTAAFLNVRLVDVVLTKTWEDFSDAMEDRPETSDYKDMVTLYEGDDESTAEAAIVDNDDDTYTVTWAKLAGTDADGEAIDFDITEDIIDNYNGGAEADVELVSDEDGVISFEVTNVRDSGDLTVTKTVYSPYEDDALTDFQFTAKLTKADGETPLAGTFGGSEDAVEFDENGEATFTLKGGESKTISGIPTLANFTVTEADNQQFRTVKTGEEGAIALNDPATAAFTNVRLVDIVLTKTWEDLSDLMGDRPAAEGEDGYLTYVTLNQDDEAYAKVEPAIVDNEDDTYTVTWAKVPTFTDDGTAHAYDIDEAAIENYNAGEAVKPALVDEADPYTFAVTNVRDLGEIVVDKTVHSRYDADKEVPFEFTVTLTRPDGTAIEHAFGEGEEAIAFDEAGKATFELADGESLTIPGIPTTASYVVEETPADGYETTVTGTPEGTFALDEAAEAHFLNVRLVDIVLTKTWEDLSNVMGDRPGVADFAGHITLTADGEAVGDAAVTTKSGDDEYTMTWSGLAGTDAEGNAIEFAAAEDVIAGYNGGEQVPVELVSDTDGVVSFAVANVRDTGSLTVSKAVWSDSAADKDQGFTFTVRLTAPDGTGIDGTFGGVEFAGGEAEVTLRDGESVTMEGIPAGAAYEVAEAEAEGFRCDAPANATGTIPADGAEAAVAFANVRLVDVTATKVWDDGNDRDALRPESVTFELWASINGTDAATGRTATLTADGRWGCTFHGLPAFESVNGTYVPVTYSVRELDAGGAAIATTGGAYDGNYTAAYSADGLTVTNRHVPGDNPPSAPTRMPRTGDPADPALTRATALAGASLAGTGIVLAVSRYLRRREDER